MEKLIDVLVALSPYVSLWLIWLVCAWLDSSHIDRFVDNLYCLFTGE